MISTALPPSALQATFASPAMARLLLFFAVHPDEALHIRELYRRTGLGMASLQKELDRFGRLGIIQKHTDGRKVVYRLNPGSERWRAMRTLVRSLAHPSEVLREAFSGVPGVEAAFVFGSQARGDTRPDSDVDLFLIADEAASRAVQDPISEAESLIGRDVDVVTYSSAGVRDRMRAGNAFLDRVSREPKQWIAGDPQAWSNLEARA
ncbi:MAG TPA: nucleotidyltransferase domain-containing protein [Longimicrobium sp.]|nr:nucleotidyltransferase domain-containing protein [Longimicrobium sp.]